MARQWHANRRSPSEPAPESSARPQTGARRGRPCVVVGFAVLSIAEVVGEEVERRRRASRGHPTCAANTQELVDSPERVVDGKGSMSKTSSAVLPGGDFECRREGGARRDRLVDVDVLAGATRASRWARMMPRVDAFSGSARTMPPARGQQPGCRAGAQDRARVRSRRRRATTLTVSGRAQEQRDPDTHRAC